MPKLRQPEHLERLAIKALGNFLCNLGVQIMPIITKIAKHKPQTSSDILESRIILLKKYFEYNVPFFLYDQLRDEVFIAVSKFIANIKSQLKPRTSMGEFLSKINVAVSLTEVLISKNLKSLNFELMPRMIRHVYFNKLNDLSGLENLNLGSLSGGWKTIDIEPIIIDGLKFMPNLQIFSLNYDCTDDILLTLIDSCPLLNTLNISSSKSITNDSVNLIFRLNNLKNVELYHTGVTAEGYMNLLLHMPQLETIGKCDEIGRVLEYIVENYPDRQQFNLSQFVSRLIKTKYLQILAKHCPNITMVSIFHNELLCDLILLTNINRLIDLRLLSCSFYTNRVREVLQVKGCNLVYLHLEHVYEIDTNALMYISQYCADLNVLVFYNCEFRDNYSMDIKKPEIPPFMNLKSLTIAAQCDLEHLEFLLSNCYNIKNIHIGTMVPTDDETFERILSKNPMNNLEQLTIICSDELTINFVYRLLEICPNLKTLNELSGWSRITEMDIELLNIFIKTNNIDLDIKSKRFIVAD